MSKKEKAGLHFVRMAAWDMFDVDALPRRERKVRLTQMRRALEDLGFTIHVGVGGTSKGERYPHYTMSRAHDAGYLGSNRSMGPLCARALQLASNSEK